MQSGTPKPVVLLDAKNGARKLLDNVGGFLWNSSKHGELKDYPLPGKFGANCRTSFSPNSFCRKIPFE